MEEIDFTISTKCNNNCIFCSDGTMPEKENPEFSDVKRGIDRVFRTGLSIMITSKEPTLNKDLFKILSYIKGKGFKKVALNTNARLFSDIGMARKAASLGIDEFKISIHGHNKKVHESITRTQKSFGQTSAAIINLVSLGCRVSALVVICKQNYRYLTDIVLYIRGLGVSKIDLVAVKPLGRACKNFHIFMPRYNELKSHVERLYKTAKEINYPLTISNLPLCICPTVPVGLCSDGPFFYFIENFDYKYIDHASIFTRRIKTSKCERCLLYSRCGGVYGKYIELYGEEEFTNVD